MGTSVFLKIKSKKEMYSQWYAVQYGDLEWAIPKRKDGQSVKCRTYQKTGVGSSCNYNKPSGAYHNVIVEGAIEHNLPLPYIDRLRAIEHNGIVDIAMIKNIANNKKEEREPEL